MKRRGGAKPFWIGILFTSSLILGGSSIFIALHSSHPAIAWSMAAVLFLVAVVLWLTLLRGNPELLSPLQSRILWLARDLRTFLQKVGPAPELHNPGPIKAGEDVGTEMIKRTTEAHTWTVAHGEWARKRLYGYQTRYIEKVGKLANEIGAESGMVMAPLMLYVKDVKPLIDFDALPDLLLEFVVKLEKPEERRRLEEKRKMQEKLALQANTPTGLQRIESPQELRDRAIAVMGGLYAFLIDRGHDPCEPRSTNNTGLESYPDDTRIKGVFPERFREHFSTIEDGAGRYGFWETISFSFADSRERISTLDVDVNNAHDVRSLINTLGELVRAIGGKHR
jgi:hypothetical protein